MNQARRWQIVLLSALAVSVQLIAIPMQAHAASIYDTILGQTESLPVGCRGGSVEDFTVNWFSHMKEASPTNPVLLKLQDKLENGEESGWALKGNRIWNGTPEGSFDTLTLYVTNEDAELTLGSYAGPQTGWYQSDGMVFTNVDYLYSYTYYTYYLDDADTCGHADWYSQGALRYENGAVISSGPGHIIEDGVDGRVFVKDYSDVNYLFINVPFDPPSGYEGAVISPVVPTPRYVAMGDSYASGEGNPTFEGGTDVASGNQCHRSPNSYPRLLQREESLDLGRLAFVACSGATTDDVLGLPETDDPIGKWSEQAQINQLSDDTEIVTLSIGGNDVGFGEYGFYCVASELFPLSTIYGTYGGCGPTTTAYASIMANIGSTSFQESLEDTYQLILEAAPNAEVYVTDYPLIFGDLGTPYGCSIADASGAFDVQSALNTVIHTAVSNVESSDPDYSDRLIYVDTNDAGSPFENGYLCTTSTSGPAFNDVNFTHRAYSLHPNELGHEYMAQILEEYLD